MRKMPPHTATHRQHAGRARQAQAFAQQQHGGGGRQQGPAAARQRIDHRQVCHAVAGEQGIEVKQVHQRAGADHGPFRPAKARQFLPAKPQAGGQPEHRREEAGDESEAMVAAGALGHDVPACVQQGGQQHKCQGGQGHQPILPCRRQAGPGARFAAFSPLNASIVQQRQRMHCVGPVHHGLRQRGSAQRGHARHCRRQDAGHPERVHLVEKRHTGFEA